jgi:hypothetical protein
MFEGQFVYTDARDALLACILETAAGEKRIKDSLRRKTRHLGTRVLKCLEADGGIFELSL